MASPRPLRRTFLRWLLGSFVVLACAEGVLQARYAIAWSAPPTAAPARRAGAGPSVLCVGDSFTFGTGASSPDRAYPDRLQQCLQREASGWTVENLGWPGRNSRELLDSIDRLLAQAQPDFLCVLVGADDAWSRPAELTLTEWRRTQAVAPARGPFEWKFRLGGLLASLGDTLPARGAAPEDRDRLLDGEAALARREWRLAKEAFTAALAAATSGSPRAAMARSGLTRALAALGQRQEAMAELAALRAQQATHPDPQTAAALAEASLALGFEADAFPLLVELVAQPGATAAVWSRFSQLAAKRGDLPAARRAIDTALELAKDAPAGGRAPLWRARALLGATDAAARVTFATDAVRALMDDRDVRLTLQLLGRWRVPSGKVEALRAACAELQAPAEVRDVAEALLRDAGGEGTDGWRRVLGSHLRQLVARARRAGVEPILLSYPGDPGIRATLAALADDESCTCIEVDKVFAEVLAREPGRTLFVADGHCSDDGYSLLADTVAQALLRMHTASGGRGGTPRQRR